jgi:hypothetical protein
MTAIAQSILLFILVGLSKIPPSFIGPEGERMKSDE